MERRWSCPRRRPYNLRLASQAECRGFEPHQPLQPLERQLLAERHCSLVMRSKQLLLLQLAQCPVVGAPEGPPLGLAPERVCLRHVDVENCAANDDTPDRGCDGRASSDLGAEVPHHRGLCDDGDVGPAARAVSPAAAAARRREGTPGGDQVRHGLRVAQLG